MNKFRIIFHFVMFSLIFSYASCKHKKNITINDRFYLNEMRLVKNKKKSIDLYGFNNTSNEFQFLIDIYNKNSKLSYREFQCKLLIKVIKPNNLIDTLNKIQNENHFSMCPNDTCLGIQNMNGNYYFFYPAKLRKVDSTHNLICLYDCNRISEKMTDLAMIEIKDSIEYLYLFSFELKKESNLNVNVFDSLICNYIENILVIREEDTVELNKLKRGDLGLYFK